MTPKTILHIDDEPDFAQLCGQILQMEGFTSLTSLNAESGLNILNNQSVDLLLLDLMLPGMSGFDLLRKIRAQPTSANIPVIIVSAFSSEESRITGFNAGADDFVVKPFSIPELICRIKALLSRATRATPTPPAPRPPDTPITYDNPWFDALLNIIGGFGHDVRSDLSSMALVTQLLTSTINRKPVDLNELQEIVDMIPYDFIPACTGRIGRSIDSLRNVAASLKTPYKTDVQQVKKGDLPDFIKRLFPVQLLPPHTRLQVKTASLKIAQAIPQPLIVSAIRPLIENAAQAIAATNQPATITVKFADSAELNQLRIEVSDDGPGWQGRLEEITTHMINGRQITNADRARGFGLHHVRRIVQALKGELMLSDSPSGGANSTIYLPLEIIRANQPRP